MKKYEITGTRSKNFRLDDGTAKAVAELSLNVYEDGELTDNEVYISAVRDDDGNITYIASSESMFDNIKWLYYFHGFTTSSHYHGRRDR